MKHHLKNSEEIVETMKTKTHKKMWITRISHTFSRTYFLPVIALALILGACTEKKEVKDTSQKGFALNDSLVQSLGIQFAQVSSASVENELKLNGKVTFNQDNVVRVFPLVGGNVSMVKVGLGDYVTKGQVLAILRSSDMAGFESQNTSARANVAIAQKNFDAAQEMYKSGLMNERDYTNAKNALDIAQAELQRTKEVLSLYGSGKQSEYVVKAPASGFIVEKNISENTVLRSDNSSGMPLFTISDLSNVWILANVYETDIARINVGEHSVVTTLAYPDKEFEGKIDKIFNVLDSGSRVMKVRVHIDNKGNLLKPEMFANVAIRLAENRSLPCIPSKSVIFDKSKYFVLVVGEKGAVEPREVRPYKISGGNTYISSGLKESEKIIVANQLLIYDAITN